MKKRLYLVHAQGRYGENTYIPLSVGVLWAYARTFTEIAAAYEMVDFLYLKEPIERAVARLEEPDLVGLAHYIWNAEWNVQFARAVKKKWPACQIIVGGVQVPDESPRILAEHSEFDFAIYGEGEGAFADFLREHIQGIPQYDRVGSLVWRARAGQPEDYHYVPIAMPRRPFTDLARLRSPYLDGVFDVLWSREKRWQVLQEFDRGCPYLCSMCAWGQAAMNELRLFPEERIRAELEWFGQRGVDYLDQADANFGIVKRDIALTETLVGVKRKYGYPKTFRTSFAKNSNDTIWTIANLLNDAQMLKSVTLAMQSMDDGVLVNIRRKNIKFDKFGDLVRKYEEAGIPTYTELILGLAGESLDSFLDGMERCLGAGQHAGLFCYLNIMLENTEQKDPKYIAAHGLETRVLQAMLTHGTPDDTVPREKQAIVVGTAAMPHADWRRGYLHMKVVEIFHAQGLLRDLAVAAHGRGMRYRDFYGYLLDWCKYSGTVAGREVCSIGEMLDRVLAGGSWDLVDSRLGDISWPPEEFAFARICLERERFYDEIRDFLVNLRIPVTAEEIARQRQVIAPPWEDTVAWAREVVWYGRKGQGRKMLKRTTSAYGGSSG